MLGEKSITALRTLAVLQKSSPKITDALEADPTSFVKRLLEDIGQENFDGLHAHVVEHGQGLPDEKPVGTRDRAVYFFRNNGEVEKTLIPGDSFADDERLKGDKCCLCLRLCCVIEKGEISIT